MGRKKRTERTMNNTESLVITKTKFKTAIYARLSKEDSGKENTDTFENQVAIIKDFIKTKEGLKVVGEYFDNGYKGTSFNRPEFNRLMDDIKKNKIDCIVVKDLSRLGRDYVETGNLIEKLFPYLGVRFISISENFDSYNKSGDIMMPLTNIVNEWYAKDISKKVKTAVIEKQKKGEFPGTHAPYGYVKSTKSGKIFEIDEETAEVVKLIFKFKYDGIGNVKIARKLNDMNIPSPGKYKYLKGIWKSEKYANTSWRSQTIKIITKDERYIGSMVYGKSQSYLYEGKKREKMPKENWIIIKNVNSPIIEKEKFEVIQERIRDKTEKYFKKIKKTKPIKNKENILKGKFVCGDCGKNMRMYMQMNKVIQYNYQCGGYRDSESEKCSKHKVSDKEKLFSNIKNVISNQIGLFLEIENLIEKNKNQRFERIKKLDLDIYMQKKIVEGLTSRKSRAYEDYSEGILTKEKYLCYREKYSVKYDFENNKLEQLILDKINYNENTIDENLIEKIKNINLDEPLNKEIIDIFIDKIKCYENEKYEIILNYNNEWIKYIKDLEVMDICQS